MSADRVADVFRDLDDPARSDLLGRLDPETKAAVTALLAYPEGTAGSIMTTEFVSVPATFLTLLDEPWEMIGHIGLYATSVVLVAEVLIFFLFICRPRPPCRPRRGGRCLRNDRRLVFALKRLRVLFIHTHSREYPQGCTHFEYFDLREAGRSL